MWHRRTAKTTSYGTAIVTPASTAKTKTDTAKTQPRGFVPLPDPSFDPDRSPISRLKPKAERECTKRGGSTSTVKEQLLLLLFFCPHRSLARHQPTCWQSPQGPSSRQTTMPSPGATESTLSPGQRSIACVSSQGGGERRGSKECTDKAIQHFLITVEAYPIQRQSTRRQVQRRLIESAGHAATTSDQERKVRGESGNYYVKHRKIAGRKKKKKKKKKKNDSGRDVSTQRSVDKREDSDNREDRQPVFGRAKKRPKPSR